MGFIQREIDRLHKALVDAPKNERSAEMQAAKQALSWATEPSGFKSPLDTIMGTRPGKEDYQGEPHPPQS